MANPSNPFGLPSVGGTGYSVGGNPYGTSSAGSGYVPGQYGTLGVPVQTQGNLGQPGAENSLLMDLGDSFMGHASYAPGGQFGTGTNANNYALAASQLGSGTAQANAAMGAQQAGILENEGAGVYGTFENLGNQQLDRQAQLADYSGTQAAQAAQNTALGLYQGAASGNGPSAAQAQLQQGNEAAINAQMSQAASARGGFGLANAQKNAMSNIGQIQSQNALNAAQLRAQEQQAGMAGYASLGNTVQAQQAANAQFQAQQRAAQQQANAQNQLQAYTTGAQQGLGYNQAAQQALYGWQGMGQQNQLAYNTLGQQALQSQLQADVSSQQATNQQASQNAGRQQQGVGSIASMIGSMFGGM